MLLVVIVIAVVIVCCVTVVVIVVIIVIVLTVVVIVIVVIVCCVIVVVIVVIVVVIVVVVVVVVIVAIVCYAHCCSLFAELAWAPAQKRQRCHPRSLGRCQGHPRRVRQRHLQQLLTEMFKQQSIVCFCVLPLVFVVF